MSLLLYFQLYEKLLDGVRRLLEELFEQGSVLGLQVDGGPPEYQIRVRLGLCGNIVLEFFFSMALRLVISESNMMFALYLTSKSKQNQKEKLFYLFFYFELFFCCLFKY